MREAKARDCSAVDGWMEGRKELIPHVLALLVVFTTGP
jgi:hypothetical protein